MCCLRCVEKRIENHHFRPSSTNQCELTIKERERERYAYECHLIPWLRIKTVIYSNLVVLSHLNSYRLETSSGLRANSVLSPASLIHWVTTGTHKEEIVYYESIKREIQRRPIYECRYDERLKTKTDGSTRLTYTGLRCWLDPNDELHMIVYHESIKRELKIKPIYECRCDERLQTKTKRFTLLSYTGLVVELEHLKIKNRLTNEKFVSCLI
jgi:hypothetical protein